MTRRILTIGLLLIAMTALSLSACSSDSNETDGDMPDGDTPDGDVDGDVDDDGDEDGDQPDGDKPYDYPDPEFVYENLDSPLGLPDAEFEQEFAEQFVNTEQLPNLDVKALVLLDGTVYAATSGGVFVNGLDKELFVEVALAGDTPVALVDMETVAAPATARPPLVAAADAAIYLIDPASDEAPITHAFDAGGIVAVASYGDQVFVALASGAQMIETMADAPEWMAVDALNGLTIRDMAITAEGVLYAATDAGVKVVDLSNGGDVPQLTAENGDLVDNDVRAIALCGERVAIASANGVALHDGDGVTLTEGGEAGLPAIDNISIACNADGLLVGHEIGASYLAYDESRRDHYVSGRWMPNNRAAAVVLAGSDRWVGTSAGVSRIYIEPRTLADKEAVFDAAVNDWWRMDGFFSADSSTPNSPWEPDSSVTHWDHDNDGLWTQMMIGGWCFAYAKTGDEKYYDYARKGMDNMFLLVDIPAIAMQELGMSPGFISRSIVSEDEGAVFQSKLDAAEVIGGKDILRWREITVDGKRYVWKGDTSSDEYAGHYFGFPVFYDLCAKTDEERNAIAERAAMAMDYIIEGDYLLIDIDGTRTLHGHWNPETISIGVDGQEACLSNGYDIVACLEAIHGGGWLNSIEVLGMLLSTWHMTGDQRYYDEYEKLIREYRYDEVAMANEDTYTITLMGLANHSDHELAMLAYTTLIRYEPNDERRARWIESLEFLYNYELPERNPWWAAVCALNGCSAPEADAAASVRTLQEMPDDRRSWFIDNSHRVDMEVVGKDRHDDLQIDRVFPYDEIRTMWWNGNPYELAWGGDGRNRYCPTNFLLPYYMNLYTGLVKSE